MNILRRFSVRALVLTLALLGILTGLQAPAHATYGGQIPVSVTVSDRIGNTLAFATGWVQFDDGLNKTQYSVALCRHSSYTSPFLGVTVGGSPSWSTLYTSPYLSGYDCFTYTNEVTTAN